MKVFRDITEVTHDKKRILTLGTFDGLHIGHKKILDLVKSKAADNGCESFVITFNPHPREVISSLVPIQLITSLDEKLELFEKENIDNVLVIHFTPELSQISATDFFLNYLYNGVGFTEIVTGYDHRFGKGREGDKHKLREWGLEYNFNETHVEKVSIDGIGISSSQIREFITAGEIRIANKLLGHRFSIRGAVVHGDMRGRTLGFPTANVHISEKSKIIPKLGVYVVKVIHNDFTKYGVMNIGIRPTFNSEAGIISEVNILDFEGDIYDDIIKVEFIEHLRGEKKFLSKDDLINQIKIDKEAARMYIKKLTN